MCNVIFRHAFFSDLYYTSFSHLQNVRRNLLLATRCLCYHLVFFHQGFLSWLEELDYIHAQN